jgi:polyphosphate kinase 2 (PPK2 family)
MSPKAKNKDLQSDTAYLGDPNSSKSDADAANTEDIRENLGYSPEEINLLFDQGIYPYKNKVSRKAYEKEKRLLQIEMLKVQRWVKESGKRIVVIYEGRDAAGKGGTIKRFMEHLNPRGARIVALDKPTKKRGSGISSATSNSFRHTEKLSSLTVPGTTVLVSNGS